MEKNEQINKCALKKKNKLRKWRVKKKTILDRVTKKALMIRYIRAET